MKNIVFIDAPTGAGKTEFIFRKMKEYEQNGLKTLFLSGRDMLEMMLLGASILDKGGTDTPLLSFELEYDVLAVDDVDMFFSGTYYFDKQLYGVSHCQKEQLVEFAFNMAKRDKRVLLSGIDLTKRTPWLCEALAQVSEFLDIEELSK